MKNKILIISAAVIILLVVAALIFRNSNIFRKSSELTESPKPTFEADFLTVEEKQSFDVVTDLKVQALKRDEQGEVMVYKIIRDDKDITNPADIKPISPRATQ